MSFLGGLFGGSAAPATPEKREHTTASDLFSSAQFDPSASANDLNAAGPSTPNLTQAPPIALPSALDTLNNAYSAQRLHPLAKLGDNLDFLALEEDKLTEIEGAASVLPSRGWTDDLCVGTGTTYLSGLAVGGLWGLKEGWSRNLGPTASSKLRLNSILNACTRRGTLLGNSLGVLAIFYNLTNSSLDYARGQHDVFNSIGAAAASGAVFKATAGVKPAAMSAGIMAGAAGAWSAFKRFV